MHLQFLSNWHFLLIMLVFGSQPHISFQKHAHPEHDCYPPNNKGEQQFLIGYGSQMLKESKDRTHPHTGESIPIRVDGFDRSWTCKAESVGFSTTLLGVDASTNKSSCINAVYFKINNVPDFRKYDAAKSYYCREEVVKSRIHLLTKPDIKRGLNNGQYWIYVTRPEFREYPTEEYPIVQSYTDTFISGCLELELRHKLEGFAEECVKTTGGWDYPWVNDRIFPRRPFLHQKMAGEIDDLLNRTVHAAFKKIKIEGKTGGRLSQAEHSKPDNLHAAQKPEVFETTHHLQMTSHVEDPLADHSLEANQMTSKPENWHIIENSESVEMASKLEKPQISQNQENLEISSNTEDPQISENSEISEMISKPEDPQISQIPETLETAPNPPFNENLEESSETTAEPNNPKLVWKPKRKPKTANNAHKPIKLVKLY